MKLFPMNLRRLTIPGAVLAILIVAPAYTLAETAKTTAATVTTTATTATTARTDKDAPKTPRADPEKLSALLHLCKSEKNDSECEAQLWRYADATGDNVLTRAEIARFLRLTSVAENWLQDGGDSGGNFIVWSILGPVAANLVLANFDFDGDEKLSRREMYMNFDKGEARIVLGEIIESGKTLLTAAMMQALNSPLKDVLNPSKAKGNDSAARPPAPKPSTRKTQNRQSTSTQPAPEKSPPTQSAAPLSTAERAALKRRISQCWRAPKAISNDALKDMAVALRMTIARDGVVEGVTMPNLIEKSGDDSYRAFANSARNAALDPACQPFNLPDHKYKFWRTLTIQFKPNIVRFD
jgi:hypothetical protein